MKSVVIGAGSDLGVHIDGAKLGPVQLISDINSFYKGETVLLTQDEKIIKSRNLSDRRKNEYEIEKFNTNLYKTILQKTEDGSFPIVIGGDHSVAVASALASQKRNGDIGIIWIDSHPDYNTFETTATGNIHGLPLAAITGYKNKELRRYHDGDIIQPARCVIVGARSIDDPERDNVRYSGTTMFTNEDIKNLGIEEILNKAFEIAGKNTKGIHISFDLDVLDPDIAPGVSVPEFDGLTQEQGMKIMEIIRKNISKVVSFDLVEFNPLRDDNRMTEQVALNILSYIFKAVDDKGKIMATY